MLVVTMAEARAKGVAEGGNLTAQVVEPFTSRTYQFSLDDKDHGQMI